MLALPAGARHDPGMSNSLTTSLQGVPLQGQLIAGGVNLQIAEELIKVLGRAVIVSRVNLFVTGRAKR